MNRYVIVDGLPYLLANGKTYSVRWDEKGFTVGAEVMLASVPARTFSELSVRAKCAGHLDSILAPEVTQEQADQDNQPEGTEDTDPVQDNQPEGTEDTDPVQDNQPEGTEDTDPVQDNQPENVENIETDVNLDSMTVKELKAYAEAQGIALDGLTKKGDILNAIKAVKMQ